jgi:hypothetical protein
MAPPTHLSWKDKEKPEETAPAEKPDVSTPEKDGGKE